MRLAAADPPASRARGPLGAPGAWVPLSGALAGWLVFVWAFAFLGFNIREDGYLLSLAERMVRGDVPYRDFSYIRPPLPIAIQAVLLAWVPGYAVAASRWYFAVEVAAIQIAVYALLARLEPRRSVRAAFSLFAVLFAFTRGFSAKPWHTVDGVFFSTLAAWALVAAVERRSPRLAAAAGAAAGAAVLCKQGFALVALVGLGLTLTASGRRIGARPGSGALAYAVGGVLVGGAAAGYLVRHGALAAAVTAVLWAPGEIARDVLELDAIWFALGIHVPSLPGAVAGLFLLALVAVPMRRAVRHGFGLAGLGGAVAAAWWSSTLFWFLLQESVYTSAWVGGAGLLVGRALGWIRLPLSVVWAVVLGLSTVYASTWSYVGIRSGDLGVALVAPLVLLALSELVPAARHEGADARGARRSAALSAMIGAGLLAGVLHVVALRASPRLYLDVAEGGHAARFTTARLRGIWSSPTRVRGIDGVVGLVQRETAPGDHVLTFMEFPALYFLSGRPNSTRVDWFLPQELTMVEVDRALVDLAARPPRLVVLSAVSAGRMAWHPRLKPVFGHILEHYEEREEIGEFLVFRPRRAARPS